MFCPLKCAAFTLILLVKLNSSESDNYVKITLKQGVLSGKVEQTFVEKKNYYSFQGVPYAVPPLGALRFQVTI